MQGHIHKRVHACTDGRRTIRWYVVVDIEPGLDDRRRQKWHGGFRTRREAEVVRARLVNDLHNNRYVIPGRLTLREWVQRQLAADDADTCQANDVSRLSTGDGVHVLPVSAIGRSRSCGPASLRRCTPS